MASPWARSRVKLSVLRRPKHRKEAAQNVIIVEVCIRGDTDCTQGVSTWLTSKRTGDRFHNFFFAKTSKNKTKKHIIKIFHTGQGFLDTLISKMQSIFF